MADSDWNTRKQEPRKTFIACGDSEAVTFQRTSPEAVPDAVPALAAQGKITKLFKTPESTASRSS